MEVDLLADLWIYRVFAPHMSIHDLLCLSRVNKRFYGLSRHNACWAPIRDHLVHWCPALAPLFDHYERQQPMRKRHKKHVTLTKRTSKGYWFVMMRVLAPLTHCVNPSQLLRRKHGSLLVCAMMSLNIPCAHTSVLNYQCSTNVPSFSLVMVFHTRHGRIYIKRQHGAKRHNFLVDAPILCSRSNFYVELDRWSAPMVHLINSILQRPGYTMNNTALSHLGMFAACPMYNVFFDQCTQDKVNKH